VNKTLSTGCSLLFCLITAANAQVSTSATTTYHVIEIEDVNIFYREAGAPNAPTLLLLHGYPSSSQEFATLIPLLADRYHIIAPDYPGFGHSDAPRASNFVYTFDHLAQVVDRLTEKLGVTTYVLYMNDYGGPMGSALPSSIPTASRRWWFRMPCPRMKGSGRRGTSDAHTGRIGQLMKKR
jgi:hypothetical protein